ncbi:hypothetical protein NLJ89_g1259 [Agrocybe chaxingu]|uniref:Uncharacterized protein n=1 Tax=Agrocybe chaxingu TaxID=84603 RepID=A0A9W8N0B4_9AGAR|nr:hypothetical protein NLJ89_g1259 [Agrocybe chaxingu]
MPDFQALDETPVIIFISETQAAIQENASYHSRLCATLELLKDIPAAFAKQAAYVADLKNELEQAERRLAGLVEATKKERKEHEAMRDSTGRKLVNRLTGKREAWAERAGKEEREYVKALEKEVKERESISSVQQMLDEAESVLADLSLKAEDFEYAQTELDDLYARIFEGPSQDFPEEDILEYQFNETKKRYEELQRTVNIEDLVVDILGRAKAAVQEARDLFHGAKLSSNLDLLPNRNVSESNPLRRAELKVEEADRLVKEGMKTSEAVRYVRKVDVPGRLLYGDILLNNGYWKSTFQDQLRKSMAQAEFVLSELKSQHTTASRRATTANESLVEVAQILEERRKALAACRRAAFEEYATKHAPPPTYRDVT